MAGANAFLWSMYGINCASVWGRGWGRESGATGHTWEWVGAKRAEGSKKESETAHSVTTLCLFAECLQIDPLTLPSGTVYFSKL